MALCSWGQTCHFGTSHVLSQCPLFAADLLGVCQLIKLGRDPIGARDVGAWELGQDGKRRQEQEQTSRLIIHECTRTQALKRR